MPEHRFDRLRWPDDEPIVDIDELVVAEGERLVLFGPNGSGKTTTLRLMAGTVGARRRDGVAYLPQRPYLFRGSGRLNLFLGLEADERVRAEALAQQLGVADRLDGRARSLSGGERMRIALARVLAEHAELVLLDEPLAPLDLRDREVTASTIATALQGRSAVIVSHDRPSAAALGDRLAVMVDGEIRQRGPIGDVFAMPADDVVADVVGVSNVLEGIVLASREAISEISCCNHTIVAIGSHDEGDRVKVLFGGEAVAVHRSYPEDSATRNVLSGVIRDIRPVGRLVEVVIDCGTTVAALITPGALDVLDLEEGSNVFFSMKAAAVTAVSIGDRP